MTELSVNLNKIALLRNARDLDKPNIVEAARTVIKAGAYGITVHPRPDERHIRYRDVYDLKEFLDGEAEGIEFNIEGNPFTGRFLDIVREVRPDQATLVPDTPGQKTSDHGWNLAEEVERVGPIVEQLRDIGVRVSLFMDVDLEGIEAAGKLGVDRIELYTEPYARAFASGEGVEEILRGYAVAAERAVSLGLGVNAGHDLNLLNLGRFLDEVNGVLEVSIGQAIIVDSIEMGLYNAVSEYLKVLRDVKN